MRRVWMFIAVVLVMMALYTLAGKSDELPPLTAKQRAEVVARW